MPRLPWSTGLRRLENATFPPKKASSMITVIPVNLQCGYRALIVLAMAALLQGCGLFSSQEEAARRPKQEPLVWKVQKNRMAPPLYLMAHQYPNAKSYLPHGRMYTSLIQKVDSVLIPYDQPRNLIYKEIALTSEMDDGLIVDSLISPEARKQLRSALEQVRRVDLSDVREAPPLAIAELLIPALRNGNQHPTYVREVWKRRNEPYRSVSGVLSTSAAQKRYQQIDYQEQGKALEQVLTNQRSVKSGLYEMANAYEIPNYKAIRQAQNKAYPFLAAHEAVLLSPVKERWFQAIQQRIGSVSMLALIRGRHLTGNKGLVKQLKEAGYEVAPHRISSLKVPSPNDSTQKQ